MGTRPAYAGSMLERHTTALPEELVPSLGDSGLDPADWIAETGSHEALIGYLDLVWRDFVLHDGCLLRASFSVENYDHWMEHLGGDRTAVEVMINHVHVLDLFDRDQPGITRAQVVLVGRLLREMWTAKLAREFPDLDITVSFPEDGEPEDLVEYEITVFVERGSSKSG